MAKVFDKIIKTLIYTTVFLVPLFWLPFSFEAFEFNKQFLLFFLVSLTLVFYLARMILVDKEVRFRPTPLDIPVLAFLLIAILSAVFSVDRISSLFGSYGRFSDGLVGLFSLVAFYFLITNNTGAGFKKEEGTLSRNGLLGAFFCSVFFVVLASYFSILGVWQRLGLDQISHLGILSQKTFNPSSGSLEGLAMFLAIVLVFFSGLLLARKKGGWTTLLYYFFLIFSLGPLVAINFSPAWMVVFISLFVFLFFSLVSRVFKKDVNRLLLVIFLLIVSSFFLFFNHSSFSKSPIFRFHQEQILGQKISWETSWNGARSDAKSLLLGSGLGTFRYDFSKFKPPEFSKTPLWQVRFDRPVSHLSEILATTGILGLISYFVLAGMFLLIFYLLLLKRSGGEEIEGEGEEKRIHLAILSAFLALIFADVLYYQNTTLLFSFWFVLAIGAVTLPRRTKEKSASFKNFPELNLVFSSLLLVFSLAILISYYLGARIYLADHYYLRSLLTPDIEKKTETLEKAVGLNPYFPTYQIVLARDYDAEIRQKGGKKIGSWAKRSIILAKRATEISPNNVAVWETLAMIYRDVRPISTGHASDLSIETFKKAIELEPGNPVLFTELGKLYLPNDIKKAREYFAKARKLNSAYLDASLQDALTYEKENKSEEAMKRLEKVVRNNSPNYQNYLVLAEVRFQLGRLYFNANRFDEAISQLNGALSLIPNNSNSLYVLGLVYEKKGEKDKAISYFKRVLKLNPGNKDVEKKINELKEKKATKKPENKKSEK